jgi:hypothetical protein
LAAGEKGRPSLRDSNLSHPSSLVIPTGPGIPASRCWQRPRVRFSFKENRMRCIGATGLHRNSGGAQRSGGICSAPCGSLKTFPASDPDQQPSLPSAIKPLHLLTLIRFVSEATVSSGSLPRKDLRAPQGALQIPPLRCAPVGMTREEGWLRLESRMERTSFFSCGQRLFLALSKTNLDKNGRK